MIIGQHPFYQKWKQTASTYWKKRRFSKIMSLLNLSPNQKMKILEVGCANGKDFIQFLGDTTFDIWAVDINFYEFEQKNVRFQIADAANLPFADQSFDLVVSIGLLEHIEPMEKLCSVIQEFERVGRHQASVVPSISTFLEPHTGQLFFPFRLHKKLFSKQTAYPLHLNYFTEHTWTKFEGFYGCNVAKIFYLPPFIKNTVIYK